MTGIEEDLIKYNRRTLQSLVLILISYPESKEHSVRINIAINIIKAGRFHLKYILQIYYV